jgi:transaldolase
MATAIPSQLSQKIRHFILKDFPHNVAQSPSDFPSRRPWRALADLGTHLWLDTGSLDDADELWTREFSALTTNNSLLNKEVQKGTYDRLIPQAADLLGQVQMDQRQRLVEIAFILNAVHALKLVQQFGAYVSVEEHTDLADDYSGAVETARRFWQICPERFTIKLPLTPAGILATRTLVRDGIRVNHTLGFSARQNYVVTRLAGPAYVNVFLGRLNSFVADNDLGDGTYVGERATLASQGTVRNLRKRLGVETLQIGASYRQGRQVVDLAGIDVMTMPPKVARSYLELYDEETQGLEDKTEKDYNPPLREQVDPASVGLQTLWDVDSNLVLACDDLEKEDLDSFTPDDLVAFFADHNAGDLLVPWSPQQIRTSAEEGKIPKLENWQDALSQADIGLDALMNLAGLNAFRADQQAMDERVANQLEQSGSYDRED